MNPEPPTPEVDPRLQPRRIITKVEDPDGTGGLILTFEGCIHTVFSAVDPGESSWCGACATEAIDQALADSRREKVAQRIFERKMRQAACNRPPMYWVLGGPDGKTPTPCEDVMEYAAALEDVRHRVVAHTRIAGYAWVSTVFMGIDHGGMTYRRIKGIDPRPILFETMIFWGSEGDGVDGHGTGYEQLRYATWDEAESGHWEMVRRAHSFRGYIAWVWREITDAWDAAKADLLSIPRLVRGRIENPSRDEALLQSMEDNLRALQAGRDMGGPRRML